MDSSNKTSVALRKESVDRNFLLLQVSLILPWSLSARRAWIEIDFGGGVGLSPQVALRKESVDRNIFPFNARYRSFGSLSARRAWIEMQKILPVP